MLGRPGAILHDGEIIGRWRPRKSGKKFSLQVQPWQALPQQVRQAISEQAEKLAGFRSIELSTIDWD